MVPWLRLHLINLCYICTMRPDLLMLSFLVQSLFVARKALVALCIFYLQQNTI